ncbi:MAG: DUF262 domain-containing protein [Vampirovibrio sp.]|nr:DUF262 domain-containing protein [Vampirovibrio sp.]
MNTEITEIAKKRNSVQTNSFPITIGEIVNLYKEKDIILRPEYQRLFRWTDEEKSLLIESILLGLPIPAIFVEQSKDNVWYVVDGLQRLSTILQFFGELENKETLRLCGLEKLDFLNNKTIDDLDKSDIRLFKKTTLNFSSISESSSKDVQYELFIRLNRTGRPLSPQEVRNVLLLRQNKNFYELIQELRQNEDFIAVSNISEDQQADETDAEWVVRFIALKNLDESQVVKYQSIHKLLDDFSLGQISQEEPLNIREEKTIFKKTFELLAAIDKRSGRGLRRFSKGKYSGTVTMANFLVIAVGLGRYLSKNNTTLTIDDLEKLIKSYWEGDPVRAGGLSSIDLAKTAIGKGREIFRI